MMPAAVLRPSIFGTMNQDEKSILSRLITARNRNSEEVGVTSEGMKSFSSSQPRLAYVNAPTDVSCSFRLNLISTRHLGTVSRRPTTLVVVASNERLFKKI